MFPVDWQSPVVRDLVMQAVAEGRRSAPSALAAPNATRAARAALRCRIGAALIRVGQSLEGGRPRDAVGQTPRPVAASGAVK